MTLSTVSHAEWNHRKLALTKLLATLAQALPDTKPRAETLRALFTCLRSFGSAQFDFFLEGFKEGGRLEPNPLYSPEYALDVTLNQIGYDLEVFLQASQQRSIEMTLQNQAETGFQLTLRTADRLAMAALQPALDLRDLLPIPRATVLTFYQKSPSIRVIPYVPVALVGIPFSATGQLRDLAAILHEVGHYVSSRWKEKSRAATRATRQKCVREGMIWGDRGRIGAIAPAQMAGLWLDGWRDEIFADVYACIIGGPQTGLTMLDLLKRLPATRWLEDDGEHPLPVLRPIIYAQTMLRMAKKAGPTTPVGKRLRLAAKQLDVMTGTWLSANLPSWITFRTKAGPLVHLDAARDFITHEVDLMVQSDLDKLCPRDGQSGVLWSVLDSVAENAKPNLDHLLQPPELFASPDQTTVGWAEIADRWQAGATDLDTNWEKARQHDPGAIRSLQQAGWNPWWLAVLSAGSWTIEGPGGGNPQPT